MLVDFGLVRDPDRTHITESGGMVGTFLYLAPEVLRGTVAGSALDRFALGHLLPGALGERLRDPDPGARPTLGEVLDELVGEGTIGAGDA